GAEPVATADRGPALEPSTPDDPDATRSRVPLGPEAAVPRSLDRRLLEEAEESRDLHLAEQVDVGVRDPVLEHVAVHGPQSFAAAPVKSVVRATTTITAAAERRHDRSGPTISTSAPKSGAPTSPEAPMKPSV